MDRHRANRVSIAYANYGLSARKALIAKPEMLNEMGIKVHLCGA